MICDHPQCTGKHNNNSPETDRCPAVSERKREWMRERRANDPEYREREHERWRERWANDPEFRERERERYKERDRDDQRYAMRLARDRMRYRERVGF